MKTKKPARIKGHIRYAELLGSSLGMPYKHRRAAVEDLNSTPAFLRERRDRVVEVLVLRLDNPDALVEQVATALLHVDQANNGMEPSELHQVFMPEGYRDYARAALRSIGVPLKMRK